MLQPHPMLAVAFDEFTVRKGNVYKRCKLLAESREYLNDVRHGRHDTSTIGENVATVKKIFMDNRRITIREVARNVAISVGSSNPIFLHVSGIKRHGYCITTMRQLMFVRNFSAKTKYTSCLSHRSHHAWPPMNWKDPWQVGVSTRLRE